MRSRHLIPLALFLFLPVKALPQEPAPKEVPAPLPGVRAVVKVTALDFDVVATSKDGKAVTDITREEVKLSINGKPVPIDYFARIEEGTIHAPDLSKASPDFILDTLQKDPGERYVPRQFLVFFDDEHMLPPERKPVIESLREFVMRLAPSDWVSLVSYSASARIMVPFTNSKELLLDGLSRLEKLAPRGAYWDSQYRSTIQDIRRTRSYDGRQSMIRSWSEQVAARETGTLGEFRRAVSALAGRSGKRSVIYISRGLELRPGQTLVQALGPSMLNQFDYSVIPQYQAVVEEANRSGVSINTIDARGLTVDGDASESLPSPISSFWVNTNLQEALLGFANETGGSIVANKNIFPGALDRIYQESSTYYSVGTTLENVDPAGKSFSVKVTSTRPDVTLKTRQKTSIRTADDAARNRMDMALITPAAQGDFPVTLETGIPKKGGGVGRRLIPFTVKARFDDITFIQQGDQKNANIVIAVGAIQDTGAKSEISPTAVPISIPVASFEKVASGAFVYNGELKSGTGNIRFVASIRDVASGRMGIGSAAVKVE